MGGKETISAPYWVVIIIYSTTYKYDVAVMWGILKRMRFLHVGMMEHTSQHKKLASTSSLYQLL